MTGILIIAHTPLASALTACLVHIYGELPARMDALDITPECEKDHWLEIAHVALERLMTPDGGALVLTDLFGATPSNIAAQLAVIPHVRVLAGVNLPMLVRAVHYRSEPLDTLMDKALAGSVQGIQQIH